MRDRLLRIKENAVPCGQNMGTKSSASPRDINDNIIPNRCDVTDRASVFALADRVSKEVGEVTVLVNNAGVMPCKPLLDHDEKEVRLMYGVNTLAHIWVSFRFVL